MREPSDEIGHRRVRWIAGQDRAGRIELDVSFPERRGQERQRSSGRQVPNGNSLRTCRAQVAASSVNRDRVDFFRQGSGVSNQRAAVGLISDLQNSNRISAVVCRQPATVAIESELGKPL